MGRHDPRVLRARAAGAAARRRARPAVRGARRAGRPAAGRGRLRARAGGLGGCARRRGGRHRGRVRAWAARADRRGATRRSAAAAKGIRGCRSRRRWRRPIPRRCVAARDAAARALAARRRQEGRARGGPRSRRACRCSRSRAPWPGDLDAAKLTGGARLLEDPACEDYRAAWEAYRGACADHHARDALILLDDLLDRFGREYDAAKAARAGVDFADLELRVRDLLADPGRCARHGPSGSR